MNKLVVVIPNYNGKQYVKNCMESLLKEQVPVLIIDNASTDGSGELMHSYADANKELVRFIQMDHNTGFCGAVNKGIREADAEFVILLNNDTEVRPGFCKELLKRIESDPRIFSVSSKMVDLYHPDRIDDAGDLYCALGWAFSPAKDKPVTRYTTPCRVFAACGGAAIYRTKIFEEIGYFDENHFAYLEDIDIGYRAMIHGYINVYEPKAVVDHAGSGVSGSRHNDFKVALSSKNSIYLIYKNMFFLQKLINLPFILMGILVKAVFFAKKGMGKTYFRGIMKGFSLSFSKKGKANKVRWTPKKTAFACRIQLDLWWNMIRRFVG